MPVKWQRLSLSNQGTSPPLLFKYTPTAGGYYLYLTDLTHVWSECLKRQDILRRADEDDTTIDPSEDSEQFRVLLQKIGEALIHKPGSSASLHDIPRGGALELLVSSKLPAPLKPLKWKICLSKEPQSSFTSHLLLPLIRAEADRESRQQNLIEQLSKKDWVLGKLFDKIEAMGIDLTSIFPGTSGLRAGRKGPTLLQAAKYIQGLAPFDEQAWLEEVNKLSPDSGVAANIVAEISGSSRDPRSLDTLASPAEGWWGSLTMSNNTTDLVAESDDDQIVEKRSPSKDAMETDTDAGAETEDDGFERQETPPRFKKASETIKDQKSPEQPKDTPLDKDRQEDKRPQPGKNRPTVIPPAGKPKGLGTIGAKKQPQKAPTPAVASPSPISPEPTSPLLARSLPTRKSTMDENETDSGTDDELEASTKPSPPPQKAVQAKPPPKSSRGLGVIGGKKKEPKVAREECPPSQLPEPQQTRSTPDEPSHQQAPSEAKKKKLLGKLGVIGGKGAKRSVEPSISRAETAPQPLKKEEGQDHARDSAGENVKHKVMPAKSPAPEEKKPKISPAKPPKAETEQEKADRKREELKRQLEAKSKAPAKKKRRF